MYQKEMRYICQIIVVGLIIPLCFFSCSKDENNNASNVVVIDKSQYGLITEGKDYNPLNGHEAVDLGLSVDWASCNLGAVSPEDYGEYYAWGETQTKGPFYWSNYSLWTDDYRKYDGEDNLFILEEEDDAAHVQWGGCWRMPTSEEWQELIDCCMWNSTSLNGVPGIMITAPNGNSIFLPKAGHRYDSSSYHEKGHVCDYWASSLYRSSPRQGCAIRNNRLRSDWRYNGFSVRPVLDLF